MVCKVYSLPETKPPLQTWWGKKKRPTLSLIEHRIGNIFIFFYYMQQMFNCNIQMNCRVSFFAHTNMQNNIIQNNPNSTKNKHLHVTKLCTPNDCILLPEYSPHGSSSVLIER